MLLNLFEPVRYVVEGLLVGAIVDQDYPHCTLVVGLCDSPKPFLAGGVPHLKFDPFFVDHNFLDLEVNT
jgi:hypothetical protein